MAATSENAYATCDAAVLPSMVIFFIKKPPFTKYCFSDTARQNLPACFRRKSLSIRSVSYRLILYFLFSDKSISKSKKIKRISRKIAENFPKSCLFPQKRGRGGQNGGIFFREGRLWSEKGNCVFAGIPTCRSGRRMPRSARNGRRGDKNRKIFFGNG